MHIRTTVDPTRVTQRLATFALLVLSSCAMEVPGDTEDEPIASQSQAINGTYDIRNCSQIQAVQAQTALESLRSMLNDGRLLACMLNGQFSSFQTPAPGWTVLTPGYPEHLVRALRTGRTVFECTPGTQAYNPNDPEWIFVGASWFGAAPPFSAEQVTGLIGIAGHELGHTKGYSDGPANASLLGLAGNPLNPENQFIASQQMGDCGRSIHSPSTNDLNTLGALRATDLAATGETVLVPVGAANGGGTNPQQQCAYNDFAVGLTGRASSNIDALGLVCGSSTITPQGGSGGGAFTLRCATGQTLVGVHGRADWSLQHIGPICGTTSVVQAGNVSDLGNSSGVGAGNVNHFFRRLCPAGHAVKGVRVRSSAVVDRLQLICQRMSAPRSVIVRQLSKTSGGGGGNPRIETCPSRSAMSGLVSTVNAAHGVARIAGACKPVSTTAQNGAVTVSGVPARMHAMLGVGNAANRAEDRWVQDDCSGLLVGVAVQTSSWMRRIRGICVNDPNRWSRLLSTPTSNLSMRGTDWDPGTAIETRTCDPGEFMVGARVTSGDWIDAVEVLCRRF